MNIMKLTTFESEEYNDVEQRVKAANARVAYSEGVLCAVCGQNGIIKQVRIG